MYETFICITTVIYTHILYTLHAYTLYLPPRTVLLVLIHTLHTYMLYTLCALYPYIHTYIYRGELIDPYNEFMIQSDDRLSHDTLAQDFNAHYWEAKFTLQTKHIPVFLQVHILYIIYYIV